MSSKNGHRTSQLSGRHFSAIAIMAAGVLYVASLQLPMAHAQVTSDGTLGTAVNLDVDIFEITGGTRPGAGPNLLHSFGSFSVGSGEAADFINDTGLPTTNILSRVTGGATSDIFGTIQTTGFPGASLFLLNPAGIVFGPGAFLDVEGSFHASTADYIKLGADGIFHADPGQPSVLTTSPPSAFGFLSANTGFIDTIGPALLVPEGATLSLVGGELFVEDTWLIAPAGDVNLVSVASAGEATFSSPINVDGFAELGPINILDGSVVDGKNIFIRGGQLVIADALVFPGGFSVFGFTPPPDGGEVNIEVTHDINISGTGPVPFLEDTPGIQTFAGFQDEIIGGDVPDIRIKAGSVTVSGEAVILALRQGPGNPPEISITTTGNTVRVENGANISLINVFEGPGGSLTIDSREVVLSGNGAPGFTGLSAQGQFHPLFEVLSDPELTFADAGSITVNASNNVTVSDAQISATSFAFGTGGNVTINTGGDLSLSDNAAIFAESTLAGPSGTVNLNATGRIDITGGSVVSALTSGGGDGGTMNVTAAQTISVSQNSALFSSTAPPSQEVLDDFAGFFGVDWATLLEIAEEEGIPNPDLFDVLGLLRDFGLIDIADDQLIAGDAGQVLVATPQLNLDIGGVLSSSTGWDGNGGEIVANIGSASVAGGAEIRSRSGLVLENGDVLVGTGNAGKVSLNATDSTTITITEDGSISTTTLGDGNGGDIELTSAGQIVIAGGGSVTADSLGGAGLTGNINITAGTSIIMDNGTVSTQAVTSDGGNIKLDAPVIIELTNSTITTSVESGVGGGGNIDIDPEFVILNNSQIIANAFGGPGGNILITANNFIPSTDSVVQASSQLGVQGNIVIESPENDIAGSISQLPQDIIDVSGLLPERCAARRGGGARSSFVVAGRGGLPTNPDNYLPSFNAGPVPLKNAGGPASVTVEAALAHAKDIALAMAAWNCSRGSARPVQAQDVISQLF